MRYCKVPENREVSFAKRVKLLYTRTPYNSCYMVSHVKNTTFCVVFRNTKNQVTSLLDDLIKMLSYLTKMGG